MYSYAYFLQRGELCAWGTAVRIMFGAVTFYVYETGEDKRTASNLSQTLNTRRRSRQLSFPLYEFSAKKCFALEWKTFWVVAVSVAL